MRLDRLVLVVLLAAALSASGCTPGQRNSKKPDRSSSGDSTPQKTFDTVNAAILKGDLAVAYDLQATAKKTELSFQQFQKDYAENRADWETRVRGAQLKFVVVDGNGVEASGKVVFGDGLMGLVDFVKEDGIWREKKFYPVKMPGVE